MNIIETIIFLHQQDNIYQDSKCIECGTLYPCRTRQLLDKYIKEQKRLGDEPF